MAITTLKSAPTISDVARDAGVNVSTVSRVMSSPRRPSVKISDKTAQRVREAARRLSYEPNSAARALRSQRTRNIGLLVSARIFTPDVTATPIAAMTFAQIEAHCAARGYSLQLMRFDPADPGPTLGRLSSRCMDGVIFMGVEEPEIIERCRQLNICMAELTGSGGETGVCQFEPGLVPARCTALRYAASLGHRRMGIGIWDPPRNHWTVEQTIARAAGDSLLANCRITPLVFPTFASAGHGLKLLEAWTAIPEQNRPTVLLAHEHVLVPLMTALNTRGLQCPRDVSLISLSCTFLSDTTLPRLTAIDNRNDELTRLAVNLLIDHVESGRPLTPVDAPAPLECRFLVRESCAPIA